MKPGSSFGRYVIVRPIGSGGMAAVYEALHVDLHKRVALKVLHPWLAMRFDVVQRFVLEARAASRFSHPHVVDILDINAVDRVPFMAMELLEGEHLGDVVDREGPLSTARLADVILPVLSAVTAAHEAGVLHRDLKPDNIFLARRRRSEHPMLLDFGISKVDFGGPAQPLTRAGEVLGTPPYMSPEQVEKGMTYFDARSDQYALGVVLYECVTGRLPFSDHTSFDALMTAITKGGAPPPSSHRPEIPPGFDALVARAMSLAPEDRFRSVIELGRAVWPFASERVRSVWTDEFGEPAAPASLRREGKAAPPHVVSTDVLRSLPLFEGAADEEMARLPAIAPALRVAQGAALFEQGTTGASCFVIVTGEIDLSRTHGADTWDVETVGPGAALGLGCLWDDAPRPVSAVARTETIAVEIRRNALARLGAECPGIADRLHAMGVDTALGRLKDATRRVADLLERSTAAVSSETLVHLAAAIGEWSVTFPQRGR